MQTRLTLHADSPAEIAALGVGLCWVGFALILIAGKRGAEKSSTKRDDKSHAGFLLQCAGYAICFMFSRPYFSPIVAMPKTSEAIMGAATIAVAAASTWLCFAAARALGKQWALVARVIENHQLIRTGPYAAVRNPIYLAMLGMLVATGLAVSRWQTLVVAAVIFMIGTAIRIRSEEKLLRETLGAEFDEYSSRTRSLFPRIF